MDGSEHVWKINISNIQRSLTPKLSLAQGLEIYIFFFFLLIIFLLMEFFILYLVYQDGADNTDTALHVHRKVHFID